MHRMSVDFPHPEGPMIAVTACSSKSRLMSSIARFAPYQAERCSVRTFRVIAPHRRWGTATAGGDGRTR